MPRDTFSLFSMTLESSRGNNIIVLLCHVGKFGVVCYSHSCDLWENILQVWK